MYKRYIVYELYNNIGILDYKSITKSQLRINVKNNIVYFVIKHLPAVLLLLL